MSILVKGHGLQSEGRPYTWSANLKKYVRVYPPHAKEGQGLCRCGEVSPVLATDAGRKRWHEAHKDGFRKNAETVAGDCDTQP